MPFFRVRKRKLVELLYIGRNLPACIPKLPRFCAQKQAPPTQSNKCPTCRKRSGAKPPHNAQSVAVACGVCRRQRPARSSLGTTTPLRSPAGSPTLPSSLRWARAWVRRESCLGEAGRSVPGSARAACLVSPPRGVRRASRDPSGHACLLTAPTSRGSMASMAHMR